MFTTTPAPLSFNLFAPVTWDGRCTRCYVKCTTAGCQNAYCEASLVGIRVFIIPAFVPIAETGGTTGG